MSSSSTPTTDLARVAHAAKQRCRLSLRGIHGVAHWQRVRENGLRLAKQTKANKLVVELFAWLHDCCREDDGFDRGHGERAAEFATALRGDVLLLGDDEFALLYEAIRDHELGYTHGEITVQTCWDADRLDLGRVYVRPNPLYLCTAAARDQRMIEWAYRRSRLQ